MLLILAIKFLLVISPAFCEDAEVNESTTKIDKEYVFMPLCYRSDPDFNECLINATEIIKDDMIKGIPELRLPSLDPLLIPVIRLEQATKTLKYKAIFVDVQLHGLGQYKFTDIDVDKENLTIRATVEVPHIYFDADYMLMGNYQMLEVEGSGRIMANFTDNVLLIVSKGSLMKKRDQMHFMVHSVDVTVDIGNSEAKFENLYSTNEDKSKINEHLINMHSKEILVEVKPSIESVLSMLIDDVASKFLINIPFDQLFPE